jgi:Protein of unknown function (DUF3987)
MSVSKENTSNIPKNKRGGLRVLKNEDAKKEAQIDIIDLENDYLKLKKNNGNPFPVEIFPKELQTIIYECHNKYQFSLDYIGAGILSASSASIGISHKVKVKHGWEEKCNLFTVIVGRPGDSKSHALNLCFKPIHIKESNLFFEYERALEEYDKNKLENLEEKNKLKKPFLKKILMSDFTPEALIYSHSNNKRGLYIYVDELHGWIKNFNRYNSSGEAETYLSLWSGTQISIDRASSKSLRLDDPFIGVIGSTQIAVLKEFAKEGRQSNGFMDRLLFVYPEDQKTLKWNINTVDEILLQNYFAIISNLMDLELNEKNTSNVIPIEKKAKKHLFKWQNNRPENYLFDYERSIEIKLQQYVIRFALILQLLHHTVDKRSKNEIELFAIKGGIKLFNYFHHTAIRVRHEVIKKYYLETLTELQKNILEELPKNFTTGEAIKIACKIIKGKPRVSQRQFKTYLKDTKLFKRISHGNYEKLL